MTKKAYHERFWLMKSWIPHLFYLGLLLAGGLYFWHTLNREQRLLAFLNRPTEEACAVLRPNIPKARKYIRGKADAYINPNNLKALAGFRQVDSLSRIPLSSTFTMEDLANNLSLLLHPDTSSAAYLRKYLRHRQISDLPATGQAVLAQNDSLRLQLAFAFLTRYFKEKVADTGTPFYYYVPKVSYTSFCAPAGQPTALDVCMSTYKSLVWRHTTISLNGLPLPVEEGEAHFQSTFAKPGIYPLKVEASISGYPLHSDSVLTTEKIFYLHVNR